MILVLCHYRNDTYMKNISEQPCLIARSLALVGDAWSILILRDAHAGLTRFDDFRKSLGIAPTMLTSRLSSLTSEGLLEKRRYSERPPRDEYVLTVAGRDFLPVLFAIGAWGNKHRCGGSVTRFFDAEAGTEIDAITIDRNTGAPVGTRPIRIEKPNQG
jgi:DNA-binding HxlR family transcriptional regulator